MGAVDTLVTVVLVTSSYKAVRVVVVDRDGRDEQRAALYFTLELEPKVK